MIDGVPIGRASKGTHSKTDRRKGKKSPAESSYDVSLKYSRLLVSNYYSKYASCIFFFFFFSKVYSQKLFELKENFKLKLLETWKIASLSACNSNTYFRLDDFRREPSSHASLRFLWIKEWTRSMYWPIGTSCTSISTNDKLLLFANHFYHRRGI